MINRVLNASLNNRLIVLLAVVVLAVAGFWSFKNIPLDAIPDLSDVEIIVFTEFPGQAPQVVED